jgi:glycosyltransferase involved in cell wall biosynthesis
MAKITVVMPTYNQGKFIREAVDSIMKQTHEDIELIIVDDGSTDDTWQLYSRAPLYWPGDWCYPKVRIIRKSNGGTGSALNEGFNLSTGKYETWFASDNKYYPAAFQRMHDFLEAHPEIDFVYTNCEIGQMDESGLVEVKRKNLVDEVNQDWDPHNFRHHYFLGIVWLWRRELRERCGPYQLEPCEDYDMALRMVEAGGRFAYLPECLGWFRRHYENISWKLAQSPDRDFYSRFVREKALKRRQAAEAVR